MSFLDCILSQGKQGLISQKQAEELAYEYERLVQRYTETMGDGAAAHMAADKIVKVKEQIILKKIENEISFAIGLQKIRADITKRAGTIERRKAAAKKGTKWAFGNPTTQAIITKLNEAYARANTLERMFHKNMGEFIEKYRSKYGGFKQDTAGFLDAVRESAGVSTGNDVARVMGLALKDTIEKSHRMYVEAGGISGRVEDWVAPHVHSQELVGRVSFEEWRSAILPRLDLERMIDIDTGLPFEPQRLNEVMQEAYESIRTNGMVDIADAAKAGKQKMGMGGGVAKKRQASRFFHFKDVESFLEYNREFGVGDEGLFDAYMGHFRKVARDTALMQILTPNPDGVMRNLELEMAGAGVEANFVKGMYNVAAGKIDGGKPGFMYNVMNGWLHIKRAAYLTGAPISALSDSFYGMQAAKLNGLPATGVIKRYGSLLNPANAEDRQIARNNFFAASAASGMSIQAARFVDDMGYQKIPSFLSGLTNRLSGLAQMTDAMKQAMAMEAHGFLARLKDSGATWESLAPELRNSLEVKNIGKAEWEKIMRAEIFVEPETGARFLMAEDVVKIDTEAGLRLGDWSTDLALYAVNEPRLATRTITTGAWTGADVRHGSLLRLISSNTFFAKSFGITVLLNHLLPSIQEAGLGRPGRLATTVIGTTLFGMMALQARQVIFGKDPRDMTDPKLWTAAMLQGGGLGLFGDFLFADTSRTSNTLAETLVGPIPATVWNVMKAGDLYSLGTEINYDSVLADLWRVGKKEIPTISLWYSRLFVERMLLDQVEKMLDPKYDRRMSAMEKRMKKNYGQGWWWEPGDMAPDRAPDFTTIGGK